MNNFVFHFESNYSRLSGQGSLFRYAKGNLALQFGMNNFTFHLESNYRRPAGQGSLLFAVLVIIIGFLYNFISNIFAAEHKGFFVK